MKWTKATTLLACLAPFAAAGKDRRPPVKSQKLQKLITEKGLMRNLQKLNDIAYNNGGNRAFGLPGYDASVDFIYKELSKLKGFKAWKEDFPALFTETTAAEVSVDDETFRTVALTYTPSTPEEGITLELVHGPEGDAACSVDNYEGLGAEGKIVLVERGLCPDGTTFAGRLKPAAAAGAVAVVIYNSDPAKLTAGSLSAPNPEEYVPAALIDQEPGQALKARLDAGETVEAFVKIVQLIEERITQNVFAETKGGDGNNLVMLGAHLDSVQAGPGINDDGSGTSLILELAKGLQHFSTNLKVKFGWWGAEENGLWGSKAYVNGLSAQEVDDLLLYLNFDMVSRGFYGVFDGTGAQAGPGGPPGSDVIEDLFVEHFESKKIEVTPVGLTGGTDYVPFLDIIKKPVGGLFTGTGAEQDACYHQACDNITNPVPETITNNAKAAAHVLSILATDGVKLIPKTPANSTTGSIRRVVDPFSLHERDATAVHGKFCDHDLI
ncbi:aminopeptidase Y precursor vacuolar [Fusarium albosuccineum]|uniref:Peptide hydrolase n=1 Tax=Fusarium albosuccineum TaxID=1237068 RepID=A0A8H4LFI5_9HYPO|nr:aminopeptidase Y precursor vacuolar [Fusarium albosuccineum]